MYLDAQVGETTKAQTMLWVAVMCVKSNQNARHYEGMQTDAFLKMESMSENHGRRIDSLAVLSVPLSSGKWRKMKLNSRILG